jgi:hypothetical protein
MKAKITVTATSRKNVGFILPVDNYHLNSLYGGKTLLRSKRGFGRKLGAVIRYR